MVIPEEIFNKVMLYNSHPVADLFKQSFTWELNWFNDYGNNFYKVWRISNCDFNESEDICYLCNTIMIYEDYCEDFVCWNEACRRHPENRLPIQYRSTTDDSDDESYDEQYGDPYESVDY